MAQDRSELIDPVGIATCFLDADDVHAVMRETVDSIHGNLDATTSGNAVEDDRQLGRTRHGVEMLEQSLLSRFVVIGRDLELRLLGGAESPRTVTY